jgi:methylated-DNA-[protein]-cysteine S-methyltransferase
MKTFTEKVRTIVRKIPKGKTMTYKEVATKAGNPKATRAVGAVMRSNYDPSIPCHRVIASDGSMRGYNRSVERKQKMLIEKAGRVIRKG